MLRSIIAASLGIFCLNPCLALAKSIERVVLAQAYGMGYGGIITVEFRPRVLFKDGTYTSDAEHALDDNPRIDGQWRSSGSDYDLVDRKGKHTSVKANMVAIPADQATIEGTYRSISGAGAIGGDVPVVAAKAAVQFMSDGTAYFTKSAGASTQHLQDGSQDTMASASHGGDRAKYRLEGYAITLQRPGAGTETKLFYFYPGKNGKGAIGIGAKSYSSRFRK